MTYKIVIGQKDGKSFQKELSEEESKLFVGKALKDTIKGDEFGFPGYEFLITGGSDKVGFPLRWDVPGAGRKRILAVKGVGMKKKGKGVRQRKTVAGNTIGELTAQINLKVVKAGKDSLDAIFNPPAEEAPKEGAEPAKEAKEAKE